jgi:NtrC-family two-component system sensor histidine kinase KinB
MSQDELGELAATFNQMAEDLSEFRRTNIGEVVRAKDTLEATLEALPDAVVLLDEVGEIQSMNRAAVRALTSAGVQNPHRLSDLRFDGFDPDAVARTMASGADANATTATDLARTIRVEQDGAERRLLPRVVPVPGPNTHQRGAVLLLYDVTDLVHLDEMRSELVAVASHELQTPLTTLRMTLLMLQEGSHSMPARQRELLATSLIGVEQLTELVHEFLDLTRIEAGELRLNLEALDLARIVEDVIGRIDAQAKARSIDLRRYVADDLPRIPGDPLRLRSVFDNVLSNALKYTPAGGAITIDVRAIAPQAEDDPDLVSIDIVDTGPGVPPSFRSRIFDKFFRMEHQQAERPYARGAGIGLYMCRQIVELHGGHIRCGSGDGDRGARITVDLPVRNAALPVTDPATDLDAQKVLP